MKKWMLFPVASLFVFAACTNDENAMVQPEPVNGNVSFEISTVNRLSTRALNSQTTAQHVTDVSVYAFQNDGGGNYLYFRTYNNTDIGWTDGTSSKIYVVPQADATKKIPVGDYKFVAVGRETTDNYTLPTFVAGTTTYEEMIASVSGAVTEIFSGSSAVMSITADGARIPIEMTRAVAGVLGYFKVPVKMNNVTVNSLVLSIDDTNTSVNLTNGAAIADVTTPATVFTIDLSAAVDADLDGYYDNVTAAGVVTLPNSRLTGAYLLPVAGVTLTLALNDATATPLKTWTVAVDGVSGPANLLANNLYSFGTKMMDDSTTNNDADPSNDDDALDLMTDQEIILTINPNWASVSDLTIQ